MSYPEKISVALCTYNGEQFLSRQLQSIQQQTRTPDELVVCDDCSTDHTIEILNSFAASAARVI
jgi:glycosyltransferase involved in cell wall biosynthesis